VINAIIQQESGGDPNAESPAGAVGLTQTMPHTAKDPGYGVEPLEDRRDPEASRRFGREYFGAMMEEFGDPEKALMAFNWGPSNVKEWMDNGGNPSEVPDETKNYVKDLMPVVQESMDQPVSSTIAGKNISDSDRKEASKERSRVRNQMMVEALKETVATQDGTRVSAVGASGIPRPSEAGREFMGMAPTETSSPEPSVAPAVSSQVSGNRSDEEQSSAPPPPTFGSSPVPSSQTQ
jgi:membrane-bound lytic murein transglycosylase MltF